MAKGTLCDTKKLADAALFALNFGGDVPYDLLRWDIVDETGWTLEYIDNLDIREIIKRSEIMRARDTTRKLHAH